MRPVSGAGGIQIYGDTSFASRAPWLELAWQDCSRPDERTPAVAQVRLASGARLAPAVVETSGREAGSWWGWDAVFGAMSIVGTRRLVGPITRPYQVAVRPLPP